MDEYVLDYAILTIHALFALIGVAAGLFRKDRNPRWVPWITGSIAVLISVLIAGILIDGGPGGSLGTHGAWYLIFSVMTVGILPILTLTSAAWSGVFFARAVRRILSDVTRDPLAV